jgi:hypothetical protein
VVDGGLSTEKPEVDAEQLKKNARTKSLRGQDAAAKAGKSTRNAGGKLGQKDADAKKPHKKHRARDQKSKGKPKKKQK